MPLFKFDVTESRTYTVLYTVEAKNPEEARQKARKGITVKEEEIRNHGVQDRDIFTELGEIKAKQG